MNVHVTGGYDDEKGGAIYSRSSATLTLVNTTMSNCACKRGGAIYADRGVAFDSEDVLQSGVLVFWPRSHGALCREVYDAVTRSDAYRRHGEDQPFFSREFLRRGLVHFLDWEFNAVWDLHHNFVAVRPDDRGDKVELMARLLFVANFVHFTSLADVGLLPEARRGYDDLAARAACEGACAA